MIDIIGTIFTQGTYDEEGNELTPPVAQEGFHVNVIELMPDMIPYQITPTTPRRVFAGAETFCLKFADRAEWLALGYETTNEDGEQVIDVVPLVQQYHKKKKRKKTSVGLYQLVQALKAKGHLNTVKALIANAPDDIKEEWTYKSEIGRTDPVIEYLITQLGISEDVADNLFKAAAKL